MINKNIAIGLIVFFSSLHAGTASAIGVGLFPDRNVMNVGESVRVDVRIGGLGNFIAPSLGVYEIDLTFNPGILTPGPVTFGDQLDPLSLGYPQDVFPIANGIKVSELSLEPITFLEAFQPDSFLLFSVEFAAVSEGLVIFELMMVSLGDALGDPLDFLPTELVTVQVLPTSTVPVPAAVWLFGTAIVGFVGMSRRRKLA